MRLLLNYKGINKIMSKVEDYAGIVQFVHENFFLKMSKWTLAYIDSDGDQIALDSDLDVQTMLDTCTRDHLKVYIKDAEPVEQIHISDASTSKLFDDSKKEEEEEIVEKPCQFKVEYEEQEEKLQMVSLEEKKEEQEAKMPEFEDQDKNHCRWKEMWRKKMEEKMAKFVDKRVESLIPCLVKQIQEKIGKKELKINEEKSGVVHEEKCTGCGISQIVGIMYKCTKCPSFNFCESCQASIPHDHNMIKMRFLEEPEKVQEKCHWGRNNGWWKRHHKYPSKAVGGFLIPCNEESKEENEVKGQEKDSNLRLTRKCFRLAKFFGEKPENFRDFVQKNFDMKFNELTQLYIIENGQGVIKNEETNEKLEQRLEKLSFYFNEDKKNFVSLVKRMPGANLKELVKIIQDGRKGSGEKMSEIKNDKPEKVEEKSEEMPEKKGIKVEEKKEYLTEVPSKEEVKPFWGLFKKPVAVDVKRKNECIIIMKDLFGPENVYEYIKLFDENSQLSQEEIISKYIEKITQ